MIRRNKPLLLVGVDGVLNCFGDLGGSRDAVRRLDDVFECVWASTRQERAHEEIGARLGLPAPWPFVALDGRAEQAATNMLSAVRELVESRPTAWIDDELEADAFLWAETRDKAGLPTLLQRTDTDSGLTPPRVDALLAWARALDEAVDIASAAAYPGNALSNFASRRFRVRGVTVGSMEGLLQGLKCEDAERQREIFRLDGRMAKKAGARFRWEVDQRLYWQGEPFGRLGRDYQTLLDEAFGALFAQDNRARRALLDTGDARLLHSAGTTDPAKTVLTIRELTSRMTALRERLLA